MPSHGVGSVALLAGGLHHESSGAESDLIFISWNNLECILPLKLV